MNNYKLVNQLLTQNIKHKSAALFMIVIAHINLAQADQPQECNDLTALTTFLDSSRIVCINKVNVPNSSGTKTYKAALQWLAPEKPNAFRLINAELATASQENSATYMSESGLLELPVVDIPRTFGTERYSANLVYNPNSQLFELSTATVYNNPDYIPNQTWKPYGTLTPTERRSIDLLGRSIPYAKLSSAAYDFNNTIIDSWELIEQIDTDSGMQAGIYQEQDTGEIVIAFRGTETCESILDFSCQKESFLDIAADALLATGFVDEQFEHAFTAAQDIANRYQDRKITVTGHSLGGGLAQATGASLGLETFAFNSAPVPEEYFEDYPSDLSAEELFNSIYVLADIHDPVSNTDESGKLYVNSSHITPLLQFDFNELEISPDRLASLDDVRFNKHGMNVLIDNASSLLSIYQAGW